MVHVVVGVVADTTYGWPDDVDDSAAQVWLTLGDLHRSDIDRLKATGRPVYGVYGNHCRRGYLSQAAVNLAAPQIAGRYRWGSKVVVGVEGCVRYKDESPDVLWTQDEYATVLDRGDVADIIVTHCPPAGCNDHPEDPAHVGIEALTRLVRRCRPSLIVHGHTYPPDGGLTEFEGAQVRYVHGWQEMTIDLGPL